MGRVLTWVKNGWKRWTAPEIIIAVGMLVLVGLQLRVLNKQTGILGQQQTDAKEEAAKTEAIKVAQQDMANSSERFAKAGEKTATETAELAKGMTDSVTQAKDSMKKTLAQAKNSLVETTANNRRSLEQSRKSLDRTIEMSHTDQRAWVGPADISRVEIKPGARTKLLIPLPNSGKTPAKQVTIKFGASIAPPDPPGSHFVPKYDPDTSGVETFAVLHPGSKHNLDAISRQPLTEVEAKGIQDEVLFFTVYGLITYTDVFGDSHWTKFRYRWERDFSTWRAYSDYNDAN